MSAVVKFIRHAPRASLEEFFAAQSCPLGERLRGIAPEVDYAGPLIKAVDELSDEEHAQLTVNAQRVTEMADEVGQTALLAVVQKRLPRRISRERICAQSLGVPQRAGLVPARRGDTLHRAAPRGAYRGTATRH